MDEQVRGNRPAATVSGVDHGATRAESDQGREQAASRGQKRTRNTDSTEAVSALEHRGSRRGGNQGRMQQVRRGRPRTRNTDNVEAAPESEHSATRLERDEDRRQQGTRGRPTTRNSNDTEAVHELEVSTQNRNHQARRGRPRTRNAVAVPEEESDATATGRAQETDSRRRRGRSRLPSSGFERQSRREGESSSDRAARLQADALHHRQRRRSERSEERAERQRRDAERHSQRRADESNEERAERQRDDAERQSRRRAEESYEERAARQRDDAERQSRRRAEEIDEERAERQRDEAERQIRRRAEESSEERAERQRDEAERQIRRRAEESNEEQVARQRDDAERQSRRRAEETDVERAERQRDEAERQSRRRAEETAEERAERQRDDAQSQRVRRIDETSEDRRARHTSDADRHRRLRNPPSGTLGIALRSRFVEPNYLGCLDRRCHFCGARHFLCEVKQQHPHQFHQCCDLGRIHLNFFENFPDRLRMLFVRDPTNGEQHCRMQRNFMENIRSFNSALAMASMGAQVETVRGRGPYCYKIHGQIYHRIGPLHPVEGQPRQYGQIYILDTGMAAEQRLSNPRNVGCDPALMHLLSELLSSINVYAQSFKMMREVEEAELVAASQQNRTPLQIRMVFEETTERGLRGRQYDLPTANEVAVVYVGENDDIPATRSLAVHLRGVLGEQLIGIRDIDKICDPLTYPLLFPTGEGGWDPTLTNNVGRRVTQKEYYSYLLSIRDGFNPILHAGKLFQQFAVDAYVKIEQNRLNFQRRNQLRLRADSYRGLHDYLASEDNSGPPGNRVILSSSHLGSPRSMQQSYEDAMAIVARYGKPTYFLTMTCNPKWKEIAENLSNGQTASDRPDLVARVFNAKVEELCSDLFRKHILGEVQASVHVIEFQKRGLPHCHMLLIMKDEWKVRTGDEVDRSICAEVPNPTEEPQLHIAVASYMIHRRCGHRDSPCMRNGSCSKKFPKKLRERTTVDVDGYPNYRRRNLFCVEVDGALYDDQWVVPTNPYLLLKYECHINLEVCGMISAVKYLYKYVYKGPDRARINIESNRAEADHADGDEIKRHLNTRYVCAPESMYRIFGFKVQEKSHTVCRLAVHLPDFQTVRFVQGREQQYLDQAGQSFTTLTAYFELNRQYAATGENVPSGSVVDPRQLYYYQIPEHFTFKQRSGWSPRKHAGRLIGRMYTVSPRDHERFCLRILLLNTKGKTSFEDLRTVDGVLLESFAEAAKRGGFLDDDQYFRQSLEEAVQYQTPICIRSFFACLLCFSEVVEAQDLWNEFSGAMSDDFIHQGMESDLAVALAYYDVLDRMALMGRDLTDIVSPPVARPVEIPTDVNYEEHERNGLLQYETLNERQRVAADEIIDALDRASNKCIFIDGPGGSGKTYLYNTVYDMAIGRRRKVVCVAWTGIAANLLPKGRTVNSLFKLNIGDGNRSSCMKRQQREARELMEVDMIIWDEISMAPKVALEAVDSLLKDIMQNELPFGGKVMIVGGDFRQVLPVVEHGQREDFVEACVHKSLLWPLFSVLRLNVNMRARESGNYWPERLLEIGNGAVNDGNSCVQVPEAMMCYSDIVTEIFGATLDPQRTSELCECAILAPKNVHVQRLNDAALDRLCVERRQDERTYKSVDEAIYHEGHYTQLFQQEYLNSLTPTGMPPHELRLKRGAIVMLLRNLDVSNGLCNGTRLKVETLGRYTLGCRFICGDKIGQLAIIPRIDNYWDKRAPFRLRRRQFPVRVAFAMTINKAQGQSFNRVGVYLPEDVFSHGQLYVALSRARTPNGIKIKSSTSVVKNIVFNEALL